MKKSKLSFFLKCFVGALLGWSVVLLGVGLCALVWSYFTTGSSLAYYKLELVKRLMPLGIIHGPAFSGAILIDSVFSIFEPLMLYFCWRLASSLDRGTFVSKATAKDLRLTGVLMVIYYFGGVLSAASWDIYTISGGLPPSAQMSLFPPSSHLYSAIPPAFDPATCLIVGLFLLVGAQVLGRKLP